LDSAGESASATTVEQQVVEPGGAGVQPAALDSAGEGASATTVEQQVVEPGEVGIQPAALDSADESAGATTVEQQVVEPGEAGVQPAALDSADESASATIVEHQVAEPVANERPSATEETSTILAFAPLILSVPAPALQGAALHESAAAIGPRVPDPSPH